MHSLWYAVQGLEPQTFLLFAIALIVAFGFEFINGFHDTANAVTTVIYTRTMRPTPAVIYSGICNCLGVLLGGTAVAFGIVNLLPVDLLVDARSSMALVSVMSLLLAGVMWNLGTWYLGLPVSSSHTLIGSILGVGIANGMWNGGAMDGVNWAKAGEVGLALLLSPVIGFLAAGGLLLVMKVVIPQPRLYVPPVDGDNPPGWVRGVLVATCGGVSFAHGSNDGQKGMGLLLLVLIGFLPVHYALDTNHPDEAKDVATAIGELHSTFAAHKTPVPEPLAKELDYLKAELAGKESFEDLPNEKEARWEVRQSIYRAAKVLKKISTDKKQPEAIREAAKTQREVFVSAIEFVPLWAVIGTALSLGLGTMIGYKRIVVTVAEKIGKTHLTYAQGAAAELVAAVTIMAADAAKLPVSTTQTLSSGVCGTMAANRSGVQYCTCRKILLAWLMTLPCCILLSAILFSIGRIMLGG